MQSFLYQIKQQAQSKPGRIVLPEGDEEKILIAAAQIQAEKTAELILLGSPQTIQEKIQKLNLNIQLEKLEIIDPNKSPLLEKFAAEFIELRKHKKNYTSEEASKIVSDINYFGTMLVHMNLADGMVSGTRFSTAETIRPAFQIIKTKEAFHKVSGLFIMIMENRLMFFADTAVNVEPNSYELADIASDTINTVKNFGLEPRVAMLSFSTNGSADHPFVAKVQEATAMAKSRHPEVLIEGELQVDAAIVPEVALRKHPTSKLKGTANVLIFPDLQSGNIAYKLVERLAKAQAIGPILQGLRKPINDLSRGCSPEDIANIVAITSCETQAEFNYHQVINNS